LVAGISSWGFGVARVARVVSVVELAEVENSCCSFFFRLWILAKLFDAYYAMSLSIQDAVSTARYKELGENLLEAAYRGDLERVKEYIDEGADKDFSDIYVRCLLIDGDLNCKLS
jgi:hypothetical protein